MKHLIELLLRDANKLCTNLPVCCIENIHFHIQQLQYATFRVKESQKVPAKKSWNTTNEKIFGPIKNGGKQKLLVRKDKSLNESNKNELEGNVNKTVEIEANITRIQIKPSILKLNKKLSANSKSETPQDLDLNSPNDIHRLQQNPGQNLSCSNTHSDEFRYKIKPCEAIGSNLKGTGEMVSSESTIHLPNIVQITNSKWKVVPSNLNLTDMENFPLIDKHNNNNTKCENHKGEIQNISIFEGGYKKLPSVRNILSDTMSPMRKEILEKWEKKMVLELGQEGFQIYRQGLIDRGSLLHQGLEMTLKGEGDPTSDQLVGIEPFWESVQHVLPNISDVRVAESRVTHPAMHYQGSVDCVARYRDNLVVVEFKTSSKPKMTLRSTYDDPLQLVAYLGALNCDHSYNLPQIKQVLLVIAYATGLPAHAHLLSELETKVYWSNWAKRLKDFWRMQGIPLKSM